MRIGIIAEGHADIAVIKAVVKAITGIDGSDMYAIRPKETLDETDGEDLKFSNWELVLQSCNNEQLLASFFEAIDDEAILIVHIDTAERGERNYDVHEPQRTGHPDWKEYSQELRNNVKKKIEELIPERHRDKVAYAIAIEETDAWLIPLYDVAKRNDSASNINAKEKLRSLIGAIKKNSKYIDTTHNNLNYSNLGKDLTKGLKKARKGNESLNLFCMEIEYLL